MQISKVNFKDLNKEFRIDAEFYRAEILDRIKVLSGHNKTTLDKLVNFIVGPFGSTVTVDNYIESSPYRYIRNKDINDFLVSNNDPALIPKDVYEMLPQFHIKENDLLITVVGTLGKVAIARHSDAQSIFSCKSTILRTTKINPHYLLTYLNSPTGQLFTLRGKRGAIQEGLNLSDLKAIEVLIVADAFQQKIEWIVRHSFSLINESKSHYQEAQNILLAELGLSNWQPKHQISFVKKYSEAEKAGRIDAEYFQPKYDEVIGQLIRKNGAKSIGEIDYVDITTGQYSEAYVENGQGSPYLRGTDISNGSINTDSLVYIPTDLQESSKKAKEGDVVVTRVGTIGLSARIPRECDGGIISDNLIRIRLKDEKVLNSYYVALFLGSPIGVSLMIRNSRGSVQQRLNQETLKEIPLPILPMSKQQKMVQAVINAHTARAESKHLLECAKRAVEIAIEQNEDAAIKWLKEQTKEEVS